MGPNTPHQLLEDHPHYLETRKPPSLTIRQKFISRVLAGGVDHLELESLAHADNDKAGPEKRVASRLVLHQFQRGLAQGFGFVRTLGL